MTFIEGGTTRVDYFEDNSSKALLVIGIFGLAYRNLSCMWVAVAPSAPTDAAFDQLRAIEVNGSWRQSVCLQYWLEEFCS